MFHPLSTVFLYPFTVFLNLFKIFLLPFQYFPFYSQIFPFRLKISLSSIRSISVSVCCNSTSIHGISTSIHIILISVHIFSVSIHISSSSVHRYFTPGSPVRYIYCYFSIDQSITVLLKQSTSQCFLLSFFRTDSFFSGSLFLLQKHFKFRVSLSTTYLFSPSR